MQNRELRAEPPLAYDQDEANVPDATQPEPLCCYLETGQLCSWGIIKMLCLLARSAWIFEITMKVEYRAEVSLDFIIKTYISLGLIKETGWDLSAWDIDCVSSYDRTDIQYTYSEICSAWLIPACQAQLLMEIALLADRAVSVVRNPGKAQDIERSRSRSLLFLHVSHVKIRCLVLAPHLGWLQAERSISRE